MPDGDHMLAYIMMEDHGREIYRNAQAPIVNVPTDPAKPEVLKRFSNKLRRTAATVLPQNLGEKVRPLINPDQNIDAQIRRAHHYNPWTRGIINDFLGANGNYTTDDVISSFRKTANEQDFSENCHVQQFFEDGIACIEQGTVLTKETLFFVLHDIGLQCVRPTLKDHLAKYSATSTASMQP